jgi:ATP-binding cassette subfamily F protein uup
LEKEIKLLEEQKKALELVFTEGNLTEEQITENSLSLQRIITELNSKEMRWFELSAKLE